ncbi:MAG: response regulator [Blastocatellia bacterium]
MVNNKEKKLDLESAKILIVDDDLEGQKVLGYLLSKYGYKIEFADNGEEGLKKAQEIQPDLILLDIMLPGIDGITVCQYIRHDERIAKVPILMVTALEDSNSRRLAIEAGADDFISKPYDLIELRARIQNIVKLNRYRQFLLEREKFERIVEICPDGIVILSEKQEILLVNPASLQMFRVKHLKDIIGISIDFLIDIEYLENWKNFLDKVLTYQLNKLYIEIKFYTIEGKSFPAEVTAGYLLWNNRPAVQLMIKDISEKQRLETQLLRSQRLETIGVLVSGIAHDLNNLLTPLLLGVEMIKMGVNKKQLDEVLGIIQNSAERGAEMVKQILIFASGAKKGTEQIQPKHILKEIHNILRDTFPKNISVVSSSQKELWLIEADATQLTQVLLNLCVNARDAMPQGGELKVFAENIFLEQTYLATRPELTGLIAGAYVVFNVVDTGIGMNEEILEKIFDPFFTTKDANKGTGLGLFTAQTIIKNYKGIIQVTSKLGEGSCFSFYIPAYEKKENVKITEASLPTYLGNGELVFIIDDELALCEIIKATLESANYQAIFAADGVEAIAIYNEYKDKVAVILLDLHLPLISGIALIRVLQKISPNIKIITTSGLARAEEISEALKQGAASFLAKPYVAQDLLKLINETLLGTNNLNSSTR